MYHNLSVIIRKDTIKDLKMSTHLWERFNPRFDYLLDQSRWNKFKYIKKDNTISDEISNVPTSQGGIYMFVIQPNKIYDSMLVMGYVGRALLTDNMNLRIRIRQYMDYVRYPDKFERPLIRRLFKQWKDYIYCHYITVDGNEEIENLEKEIVNSMLPPFNSEIFDITIRAAVKAF
ncbi:hypothetical protein [Peloplasma aerotolerans]|uniref:GIY-YIG domain-containing protein n=1 Tax=Peloplasma aerotolerans TaxID=3044389 RepID=A0AAW6UEU4_9MOLU|nr:hypothetical protein [Mariniplasma sp. M4Ah]MDI6453538.1 hypothetical protein [Mariniplasma sp. M4Ah]